MGIQINQIKKITHRLFFYILTHTNVIRTYFYLYKYSIIYIYKFLKTEINIRNCMRTSSGMTIFVTHRFNQKQIQKPIAHELRTLMMRYIKCSLTSHDEIY